MRTCFCLLACLLLAFSMPAVRAEEVKEPVYFIQDAEADSFGRMFQKYDTPTLKYTIEVFRMHGEQCYLTRVWVRDPARQIRKATSEWKKRLDFPKTMAARVEGAALVINGSGYVSPQFPEIPDNYPGESKDYFYTPLGSLTVTDGEVFRNLEGVPYYGLTLDADGLQMYTGEDNGTVLASGPVQTWSFYTSCPMMRNNRDLLPEEWDFADMRAERTIIARVDRHNYLILTADSDYKGGLSLRRAEVFFQENFDTEWVYNLDGGPSSALLFRKQGSKKMNTAMGGGVKDEDILAFTE